LAGPAATGRAGARVTVAGGPVSVAGVLTETAGVVSGPPSRVRVEVLGRDAATTAGVNGVLLRLARADGVAAPGSVVLEMDVSGFAGAFGGDWASRLRLFRYPACVLTRPEVAGCATPTLVDTARMDSRLMRLSAAVAVGSAEAADSRAARADGVNEVPAAGDQVFAVMAASASSDTGTFARTPLSLSSSWQAGDSGGDFAWSYGLPVPPVPGDLAPEVSLSYSSGAVDGQVASRNVQPSWLGEGWNFHPGYIERSYRPCKDDVATGEELRLYRGNGAGGFLAGHTVVAARLDTDGAVFSPGDLSGDGEPDVIFRDGTDKNLWMARGDGSGGWVTESGVLAEGDWSGAQFLFSPGDFSGDGVADVMARDAAGALLMRRGTASGGLEPTWVQVHSSFGAANMIFSPGDFNGDGHVDVLWRRASDAALLALWGNGAGGWLSPSSVVLGTGWSAANLFTGGDFSGDGNADVVVRRSDNNLYLYQGNGTGGWINSSGVQIGTGWGQFQSLAVVPDFDGDGDADLIGTKTPAAANPTHANATADLCWRQPNARLVWGGKSTDLVLGVDGVWRAEADDGAKVELLTDTVNGDNDGEYWRLTTVDGVEFYFGRNRLPNWTTGKRETNSAWTVPVFANHNGEPCFNAAGFTSSRCDQAYQWNLDYVVDPADNSMAYFYGKEQAKTGLAGNPSSLTSYTRGGTLDHIEYGMRAGTELATTTPPAKVVFGVVERCLSSCWSGAAWNSPPNAANWPDTPWDLHCPLSSTSCPTNVAPSFWSTRRLTSVTTQIWSGSGTVYTDVDSWTLGHSFPTTGNNTTPVLWLSSITHTGKVGGTAALPAITFGGVRNDNRAFYDPTVGVAQPRKYRLSLVQSESGGEIAITYLAQDPNCLLGAAVPDPEKNPRRCFAQWIDPDDANPGWSWWHKYVVATVKERDLVGGSPEVVYSYAYAGSGSSTNVVWAHDDGGDVWTTPLPRRSWADWRGYPTVTVTTGPSGGPQTQTRYLYFRGLDGDYTAQGKRRTVTVTNSAGAVTTDHSAYAGRLHETIELDGPAGVPLRRTIVDPVRYQTGQRTIDEAWGIPTKQTSDIVRSGRERVYTWLAASSVWRQTETTRTWHPRYGIITQVDDAGDTATTADDLCTRYTYAPNTGSYLIDYPSVEETVGVSCATTPTLPADALGAARYFYDNATVHGTAPTVGNVTKVDRAASYTGSTPNWIKRETAGYDSYGRVTSAGDALDRTTTTVYTHGPQGLLTGVKTTNPALHDATVSVHPARGLPLTATDANGKVTTGAYDALGRLTKVWLPGRATTLTGNAEYVYTISKTTPSHVQAKALGPNGNQIISFTIYDGLLRTRQTQATAPDGKRTITDTGYDARGLAAKQSSFYNNASAPTGVLVAFADTAVDTQTRHTYDGLGRPTIEALWSRNVLTMQTAMSYDGDRVNVDPPTGATATTTISDARGRTTALRQYHGGAPTGGYDQTSYGHDRAGRLTSVTDPAGNDWGYGHDLLGRTTRATDPDTGSSTLGYDNADQLITSTDARGETLWRRYDTLGRTIEIRDDSATGALRASRTYDTVAKGQPTSSTRHVGTAVYTVTVTGYTDLYAPAGSTVTIPAAEGNLAGTYTSSATYKVDGSPATTVLPALAGLPAETLSYGYSDAGLPTTMTGASTYVASTTYHFDGQIAQRLLGAAGKQVRHTLTPDPATRRLTTAQVDTENPTTPGTFVDQSTDEYGYDQAGNVTTLAGKTAGTTDQVECFRYDHLRRLTDAWTETSTSCAAPQRSGADPYRLSWTYDTAGNRTTQTSHSATGSTTATYTYPAAGASQPHTVTSIAYTGQTSRTDSYGYDPGGYTTTRTVNGVAQTLTWDAEGHLATTSQPGQNTSYLYDADGNRLLRRDATGATLYLGTTELRLTTSTGQVSGTRYYGHGAAVVAVRTSSGLTWLVADHHGTNQLAVDATTLEVTRRRSMPFGEPRGAPPVFWPGEKGFVNGTQDPTGLTHLGAREYDPTTGRFISADPIIDFTDPQQINGYAYAHNNPTTYSDPGGLRDCDYADCDAYGNDKTPTRGKPKSSGGKPGGGRKPGEQTTRNSDGSIKGDRAPEQTPPPYQIDGWVLPDGGPDLATLEQAVNAARVGYVQTGTWCEFECPLDILTLILAACAEIGCDTDWWGEILYWHAIEVCLLACGFDLLGTAGSGRK